MSPSERRYLPLIHHPVRMLPGRPVFILASVLSGLLASARDPYDHHHSPFVPNKSPSNRLSVLTVPTTPPSCIPNNWTVADMNELLSYKGVNFTLTLCSSTTYSLETTIIMTAPGQEISTEGYPTDETRAMLVVNGSTDPKTGLTTAIYAACPTCNYTKIRNIQIDGNRGSSNAFEGGANLETGGPNVGQVCIFTSLRTFIVC